MDDFLKSIINEYLGNTFPVRVSSLVGIITAIIWLISGLKRSKKTYYSKNVKLGIYLNSWFDPIKCEMNFTIARLTKFFGRFKMKVLFVHKDRHNDLIRIESINKHQDIFEGTWSSAKHSNSIYRGPVLFRLKNNIFEGKWMGPKSNHEINGGAFNISFIESGNNEYIYYKTRPIIYWIKQLKLPKNKSIISDIIEKHKTNYTENPYEYKGISLDIPLNSFNPKYGKISTTLLEYVKSSTNGKGTEVLDIGSGVGFYSISLSKSLDCKCIGVEISSSEVSIAASNATKNNVDKLTEFRFVDGNDPFEKIELSEKFDTIIANLPFARRSESWKSRNEAMYNCFYGSRSLIEKLILGSLYHIKQNGRLVFSYSEKGYYKFLVDMINISPWKTHKILKQTSKDDTFYVFDLRIKDNFRGLILEKKR